MTNLKLEKYFWLFVILGIGFIAYAIKATYASLWYDEAVEYFYSKYITGEVPGGFGTINMYERICRTYQPPLYNVLMYFWLMVFDSELGFRMAGIITTLAGAVGIFKAMDEQTKDTFWPNIGALAYIFTASVAYYGLECAEYNLMLSFMSWTVYFYIRVLKRKDAVSLAGFFVFACLSVYSQYGAAFIVAGMFSIIAVNVIKSKNKRLIIDGALITILTGIFAVLPLLIFFLFRQMNQQGSMAVSHTPVFLHNPISDYIIGIAAVFSYLFALNDPANRYAKACIIVFLACTLISMLKKHKTLISLVTAMIIAWTIYFIAVACSFYGYNSWNGALGCHNIGGKYVLFLAPILLVSLITGTRNFLIDIREKSLIYKVMIILCVIQLTVFCVGGIWLVDVRAWNKYDMREATKAWYECSAYESKTLLHQRTDAMFHFYLMHDDAYNTSYKSGIVVAEAWIKSANEKEIEEKLTDLGYLDLSEFYYVAPAKDLETFLEVVETHNYTVDVAYDGKSTLLRIRKRAEIRD